MKTADNPDQEKIDRIKPAMYSYWFHNLKEVAQEHGWNLVLHGSLHRDLDLIMIPWQEKVTNHVSVIKIFAQMLGGRFVVQSEKDTKCFPHGRLSYIINVNRGDYKKHDPQFYLDISVIPPRHTVSEGEIRTKLAKYFFEKTNDNCISYRHDFGLLPVEEQRIIAWEYSEWVRAIQNNGLAKFIKELNR